MLAPQIITERAKAVLEQCYEEAVAAGEVALPPAEDDTDRPDSAFQGQDLVALRDGRLAAPAKVRIFGLCGATACSRRDVRCEYSAQSLCRGLLGTTG